MKCFGLLLFSLAAVACFASVRDDGYYNVQAAFAIPGVEVPAQHNALAVAGKTVSVTVGRQDGSNAYRYDYTITPRQMPDGSAALGMSAQIFKRDAAGNWILLMEPTVAALPGATFTLGRRTLNQSRAPEGEMLSAPYEVSMTITPVPREEVAAQFGGQIPEPKSCNNALPVQTKDGPACCSAQCVTNPENIMTCCGALWCCDCGTCCKTGP